MSAEKEYLEVTTEIKDHERKIEVLKKEIKDLLDKDEEDYQRLLDKDVLTESEKYRKNNFESKLAELKEDLTKLKKTEDFWMSHMKILQQKTVAPTGTLKQSTPVSEESISEKLTESQEKLQKKVWK